MNIYIHRVKEAEKLSTQCSDTPKQPSLNIKIMTTNGQQSVGMRVRVEV